MTVQSDLRDTATHHIAILGPNIAGLMREAASTIDRLGSQVAQWQVDADVVEHFAEPNV